MADFYITLPSNTVAGNLSCDFRVHLPDSIHLAGNWEVALAEIMYVKSWNNLNQTGIQLGFVLANDVNVWMRIPNSHYENVEQILLAIHNTIEEFSEKHKIPFEDEEEEVYHKLVAKLPDSVKFGYDQILKRVFFKMNTNYVHEAKIYGNLQYMLSFATNFLYGSREVASYPVDIRGGIDALYVYCDLVENAVVGNIRAPLLRTVPVRGVYGDVVDEIYQTPHYAPLLKKDFNSVHISIKDDRNRLIPFAYKKTIVKLHFRKRKNLQP